MTHRNLREKENWCDNVAHSPRATRPGANPSSRATVAVNRRTTVRLKALFSLLILGIAGAAIAQAPAAPVVVIEEKKTDTVIVEPVKLVETPKPPFVFELHGFVSGTIFMQDQVFGVGPGQNSLFVSGCGAASSSCRDGKFIADKLLLGGDIRQTRLNFSVAGPEVFGGAKPKAIVEVDFFGADNYTAGVNLGAYGDVSVIPRLRVAVAELKWGGTTIQVGQQNMLTIGLIPQSLSHIAFPYTYAAGTVGWRQPGIWAYHMLGSGFELAWSIARAGWIANSPVNGFTAGVASGLPALELRAKFLLSKDFDVWASGHWQTADRNGPGNVGNKAQWTSIDTILGTVGVRANMGFLVLQGSGWYGKNAGPLLGNIIQFPAYTFPGTTAANSYFGDIFGWGAWGQAGLNLSKAISLWYTIGVDHPSYDNIIANYRAGGTASTRLRNLNQVGMLRFMSGGYAFGLEYFYSRTTDLRYQDPLIGNQLSLTANYSF
jgi:hypothetical protein